MPALLVCLLFWVAAPVQDTSPTAGDPAAEALLDRWQQAMGELESFRARFRQEKKVSFLRRSLVSEGTIHYRKGRLLWATEKPAPSFLALDEQAIRIYTPEFATLEIYSLEGRKDLKGAMPGLTFEPAELRKKYDYEVLAKDPEHPEQMRLRFEPKVEALQEQIVAIQVTLDKQGNVRGWTLEEVDGDRLELTLIDFQANVPISDEELTFEVPDDVKVVRYDGGSGGE